jgi:microcystin-dependent protein
MEGTMSEIRMFAGNFAPRAWAYCQGQLLAISTNSALFSLIGTTYGGDGRTTFALPNLAGRAAVGTGNGPGLSYVNLGEMDGTETVTLLQQNLPVHNHAASGIYHPYANNGQGDETNPGGGYMSSSTSGDLYASSSNTAMGSTNATVTLGLSGSTMPHQNMQPYLGMNYIICMQGIYPSRG